MSDSIDRQKVLNTLDFADNALTDEERTVEKYKELLTECIKVLPTAEDNGDLISRQAVENITWEEPSYTDPLNVLTEVREKVRALPTVEKESCRCNTCVNSDDEFSGECYECLKGIFDHYETEVENGRTND